MSGMKIRSFSITKRSNEIMEALKDHGVIVSASEYVRKAIDNQLVHDIVLIKEVVDDGALIEEIMEEIPEIIEYPTTIIINGKVWQKQ